MSTIDTATALDPSLIRVLDAPACRSSEPEVLPGDVDQPPINTTTATTVLEIAEPVGLIEDEAVPALASQFTRLEALGVNTNSDLERSLGQRAVKTVPEA